MRDWLEYALARLALAALAAGPPSLARFYFRWIERAVPKWRRVAEANLRQSGLPAALADEVFASLARQLWIFARLPTRNGGNIGDWIEYEGFAHYAEAKRRGKGVLFATGHLGAWELSHYAHALLAEPMDVVVRPLDNPLLDRFVKRRREACGNRILGKKDLLRDVVRSLRENRAVGILLDQDAGLDGVFVDFFGRPASSNATFAKLAHRTGAAVIPGFAVWEPARSRYVLRFDPIVEMTGDLLRDTQAVQLAIEKAVRRNPGQWLWIHRRWKTRPQGGAG